MEDYIVGDCKLYGCYYNKNGDCVYNEAAIKVPYEMACRDEIEEPF